MDVPGGFKAFLKLDEAEERLGIVSGIVDPVRKGTIISLAALAEEEITKFLVRYFAAPDRRGAFCEVVDANLTFHAKIETAKKVIRKLDATKANYEPHFAFLRALKKARNTAAHSYSVSIDDASKLASDTEVSRLFGNFPTNVWQGVTSLRDYLDSLEA